MRKQTTMRIVRSTLLGFAGLGAAGWSVMYARHAVHAHYGANHSVRHERANGQRAGSWPSRKAGPTRTGK